jgi:hypothetical protein
VIENRLYVLISTMVRPSQRPANVDYYARNRSFEQERIRVRQRGTVELLRELRCRPCSDCGSTFAPHQMDFDHRAGTGKRFRLTEGGAMLRPSASILEEAAKCDIVCANCHRVRTQRAHAPRQVSLSTAPGTVARRERWRIQARVLDDLRDRPCVDCGGRFPPCAMDFDHRDPATKRSSVTRLVGRAGTARLLDEAAKCDIVCANCHRLRTFERRNGASMRE